MSKTRSTLLNFFHSGYALHERERERDSLRLEAIEILILIRLINFYASADIGGILFCLKRVYEPVNKPGNYSEKSNIAREGEDGTIQVGICGVCKCARVCVYEWVGGCM